MQVDPRVEVGDVGEQDELARLGELERPVPEGVEVEVLREEPAVVEPGDEAVAVDGFIVDRKPDRLELLRDLDHERGREERIDRVELRCHAEPEMLLR
jgi:hypothetical protein